MLLLLLLRLRQVLLPPLDSSRHSAVDNAVPLPFGRSL